MMFLTAAAVVACDLSPRLQSFVLRESSNSLSRSRTVIFQEDSLSVTTNVCFRDGRWHSSSQDAGVRRMNETLCDFGGRWTTSSFARPTMSYCFPPGRRCDNDKNWISYDGDRGGFPMVTDRPPRLTAKNQTWMYKRCTKAAKFVNDGGPLSPPREMLLQKSPSSQIKKQRRRVMVYAGENLANPSHAARDLLFTNAVLGRWPRCFFENHYSIAFGHAYDATNAKWRFGLAEALQRYYHRQTHQTGVTVEHVASPKKQEERCYDFFVEKTSYAGPADARDAGSLRRAAYEACGVDEARPPSEILYLRHGPSKLGDRELSNLPDVARVALDVARRHGLAYRQDDFADKSFCDQVRAVANARILFGGHGAAVGGNLIFTRGGLTVELALCPRKNDAADKVGIIHNHFATAHRMGVPYVVMCLCLDGRDTTTFPNASNPASKHHWWRSPFLVLPTDSLRAVFNAALGDHSVDWPKLQDALASVDCRDARLVSNRHVPPPVAYDDRSPHHPPPPRDS